MFWSIWYKAERKAREQSCSVFDLLNGRIAQLTRDRGLPFPNLLVKDLHVLPDFHGNRSPRPSPHPVGTILGLSLDRSLDSLAIIYYAAVHSLVYGTLVIIEKLSEHGVRVKEIVLSGGMARNALFAALHSEILERTVVVPEEPEHGSVRGAAIVGALAAGVEEAVWEMGGRGVEVKCSVSEELRSFHRRKFQVVGEMVRLAKRAREINYGSLE